MIENILESEYRVEDRRLVGRLGKKILGILISPTTRFALLLLGLGAQTLPSFAQAPSYGTGVQAPLRFSGEAGPSNLLSLGMGVSAMYDDNIFQTNSNRISDESATLNPMINLSRQTEHMSVTFGYMPFFLFYRQNSQFDQLNHSANLNFSYELTPRVRLGLYDTFSYLNANYPSVTDQQILSGLASPTAVNQGVLSSTVRTLTNSSGLDLAFTISPRTSLTLIGNYNQQNFGNPSVAGQHLYGNRSFSGGLQYQYRITAHTNFGIMLLHQDSIFRGAGVFGSSVRSQTESAFFSLGTRVSPSVSLTLFGGPQYVRTVGATITGGSIAGQFAGSGGGSITKQVHQTAFDLSLQRIIATGDGLYTLVTTTTAGLGVRRRLIGRWESDIHCSVSQADTSLFQLAPGRTDSLIGGVDFSRQLWGGNSTFRISYITMHQLSKGALPVTADFDRNEVTIGFDFRLKAIPLGM